MAKWVMLGTNVAPHLHGYSNKYSVKLASKFYQQAEVVEQVLVADKKECFVWHTLSQALPEFYLAWTQYLNDFLSSIKGS